MRVFFLPIFLTFVLSVHTASAAPSTTTEMNTLPYQGQDDPLLTDKEYLASIDKPPQYHMGFHLGYGGGNYLERDQYVQGPYARIHFSPLADGFPHWEYAAEVNKDNIIGVFFGKRWYCCPEDSFLPYYKISVGTFLDADSGLANFAEIKRLRARAAWGLGKKITTEIGAGLSISGPDLYLQFGFPWEF